MKLQAIENIALDNSQRFSLLRRREHFWIFKLRTLVPSGLNELVETALKTCKMSIDKKQMFILGLTVVCIFVVSFTIHQKSAQPLKLDYMQVKKCITSWGAASTTTESSSKTSTIYLQIKQIMTLINQTIPNVDFTDLNKTTSAKHSTATIVDYKPTYCVGEDITVRVDMYNYLGEKKTYGGDFLRARIFSPNLAAGASGKIEDFKNGTYNVYFTLFWEGVMQISILMMHPSEGVSALWNSRNKGYKYIAYTGIFLNRSQEVQTECGFFFYSHKEKCEYLDTKYGESFYCIRPPGVACEAFIFLKSRNTPYTDLTNVQKKLFTRSNIRAEISKQVKTVNVSHCTRPSGHVTAKCQTGLYPPFPSGYFLQNQWFPIYCNLSNFEPLIHMDKYLAGKRIYLMGDSTIRQWIEYFTKVKKSLKYFDNHGTGWHKTHLAIDSTNNLQIQWKKHGHPFVTQSFFNMKDHSYITNEIDQIGGGAYTIIVISVGQHFRPFPLDLFIRRVLNIRKAIENLFLRSPDTKVIIKSENTREINTDVERFSDFHGYVQYLLVKDIFKGLNVGVIDAWDMATAYGSYNVHPPETVIKNQINLFLSYIS
ncbi:NXPE family member 1-like [Hyla sarda]|uniref:NXPE family member 1-like n=1 Tax=Hyla sarda TaxID=327740 RepID=UPI0024C24D13|nr:NXPE family member 1-like [Hyla sarda]